MQKQTLSGNEWLVMEALWRGPATLMELVHLLEQDPPGWAKSTTATMVRRMEAKGLIGHETHGRTKVFYAVPDREAVAVAETKSLLDRAFSGSLGLLVNALVREERPSREELRELYEILKQAEEDAP